MSERMTLLASNIPYMLFQCMRRYEYPSIVYEQSELGNIFVECVLQCLEDELESALNANEQEFFDSLQKDIVIELSEGNYALDYEEDVTAFINRLKNWIGNEQAIELFWIPAIKKAAAIRGEK